MRIQGGIDRPAPAPAARGLHVECAALTDAGRVRTNNEDSLAWDTDAGLFLVADGMGGCNAGEVASRLAVRMVLAEFRQLPLSLPAQEGCSVVLSPPAMRLCTAILKANRAVFEASLQQPEHAGMGTTLVAVLFHGQRAIIASIGDSRVYRFRAGQLEQLTVDHTVLQEQIEFGLITPEQARLMGGRGLITRALGVEPGLEVDVQEQALQPGDVFLLCTDGLFDMIADEEIAAILAASQGNVEVAARSLVGAANAAGGYDNVSVIAVRID